MPHPKYSRISIFLATDFPLFFITWKSDVPNRIHLIFSGPLGVHPCPCLTHIDPPPTTLAAEETLKSKDLKNTVLDKLLGNKYLNMNNNVILKRKYTLPRFNSVWEHTDF